MVNVTLNGWLEVNGLDRKTMLLTLKKKLVEEIHEKELLIEAVSGMLEKENGGFKKLSAETKPRDVNVHEVTVDSVKEAFPEDLRPYLTISDEQSYIKVKSDYVETEIFRRISGVAKDTLGGEYVSAGKNTHFKIPK